jgi:hypothetical protein
VQRVDAWNGIALAATGVTVAAAGWNASWLAGRAWGDWSRPAARRRFAAGVLAILNGGIALESMAAQALYVAHHAGWETGPLFAPPAWIGARMALLCGTLALSALILRRAQ